MSTVVSTTETSTLVNSTKVDTFVVNPEKSPVLVASSARGPKGLDGGTYIGGVPVNVVDAQTGDFLQLSGAEWVNSSVINAGYF